MATGQAGRGARDRLLAAVGARLGCHAWHAPDPGPRDRRDRLHPDAVGRAAGAERRQRLPDGDGDRHGLTPVRYGLVMARPDISAVVFDIGGVLLDWDPRHLYRQLIGDPA